MICSKLIPRHHKNHSGKYFWERERGNKWGKLKISLDSWLPNPCIQSISCLPNLCICSISGHPNLRIPFLVSQICVSVPFLGTQIWVVSPFLGTTHIWVPRNGILRFGCPEMELIHRFGRQEMDWLHSFGWQEMDWIHGFGRQILREIFSFPHFFPLSLSQKYFPLCFSWCLGTTLEHINF